MGWASRNKYKGSYDGFHCTKCFGTGIRGWNVDIRGKRTPVLCKCSVMINTNDPKGPVHEPPV